VKQFCKERRFSEYSFYTWRKRLRAKEPVRFALLERGVTRGASAAEVGLELVLTNGERLRISKQVDMATLRWCSMRCGDDSPAGQRAGVSVSEPCDMRRSFDGLHALVRDHLHLDAFAGHLYLFANKRKDRVKILYWGVSRR
jgi:hypothetical protein